jgi:hypothetical protein
MSVQSICEVDKYGHKRWMINNQYHREDGPAIEYANGDKCWYQYGKYHREDGPAIEFASGGKLWYYHGQPIYCQTNEEYLRLLKLKAFW